MQWKVKIWYLSAHHFLPSDGQTTIRQFSQTKSHFQVLKKYLNSQLNYFATTV